MTLHPTLAEANGALAALMVLTLAATPAHGQQALARWSIDADPAVEIGSVSGADEYLFISPQAATVLSDGRIAITEGSNRAFWIRYYDRDGRFIRESGGFGDGPFEFRSGAAIFQRLPEDSLFVATPDRRFAVFGPDGGGVRTGRLGATDPYLLGIVDESHIVTQNSRVVSGRDGRPGLTVYESRLSLVGIDSGDKIALPGTLISRGLLGERGLFLHLPFEPRPVSGVGGGRVWWARSDDDVVLGTAIDGGTNSAKLSWSSSEVTRDASRRWREWDLEGTEGQVRQGYERHHLTVAFPDSMPRFSDLTVDLAGRLWVLRYEPPWSVAPLEWHVYSPDGSPLAVATAPATIAPELRERSASTALLEIGEDYVLVRRLDEWGVASVAKHRIRW